MNKSYSEIRDRKMEVLSTIVVSLFVVFRFRYGENLVAVLVQKSVELETLWYFSQESVLTIVLSFSVYTVAAAFIIVSIIFFAVTFLNVLLSAILLRLEEDYETVQKLQTEHLLLEDIAIQVPGYISILFYVVAL